MKFLIPILLFFSAPVIAQDYVDILRIGYGQTLNNDFEGTGESTKINLFDISLTYPVVVNENNAIITGVDFGSNRLQLFPNDEFTNLYTTTLKIGLATTFNEKWSGTFVLLPKVASDYSNISSNDFYFGGYAVAKLKKSENFLYRFGFYASDEAFGIFATPIFGWYYKSKNDLFEMDVSLPIAVDINYKLGGVTLGMDYFGIGRSFNLDTDGVANTYTALSSLDFAAYAQLNFLDESVLIRGKVGYSSNDYQVYATDQKIDFGLSAFSFGDDRTQLNPSLNGSIFLKFEAIYRFDLGNDE